MQNAKIGMYDSEENSSTAFPSFETSSLHGERVEGRDRNSYFNKFVILVFITSGVIIFFSWTISKIRQDRVRMLEVKKVLEKQATRLEAENLRLENEYSALKKDPVRIEKEAREVLGYTGSDEIIISALKAPHRMSQKKLPHGTDGRHSSLMVHFPGSFLPSSFLLPWPIM